MPDVHQINPLEHSMQKNLEIVEAAEVTEIIEAVDGATPVELTVEQLEQVGGGLSPNSNWG